MGIVNQGRWAQITVSTGAVGIRTLASILRRDGYRVSVSSMGDQITSLGRLKMTLIDVRPGDKPDTFDVSKIAKCHIPELRD